MADVPLMPSLTAAIDVLPAAMAVTRPEAETVATAEFAELQVTVRPVNTLLLASLVTAESCTLAPTCRFAVEGDTETVATGIGGGTATVKADPAVLPSLLAEIMAVPGPTAVTSPLCAIVAMLEFEDCHVIVLSTICLPVESLRVAVA